MDGMVYHQSCSARILIHLQCRIDGLEIYESGGCYKRLALGC